MTARPPRTRGAARRRNAARTKTRTTARTKTRGAASTAVVDLETKTLPAQARSRVTFDAILRVAGEILNDEGLDALSVNAVCRRTGFTPPAVYRYFPNKYALLKALAERLMEAQDDVVLAAARRGTQARSEAALSAELREVLRDVAAVTAAFPGNVVILRALRVTPVLKAVRRASTAKVAAQRFERLRAIFPDADVAALRRGVWLGMEVANGLVELIAEREWEAVGESRQATIDAAAALLAHHYWQLGGASPSPAGRPRSPR